MPVIRNFRELDVYLLSVNESHRIFAATRTFPREEIYSLTDQVRRSSRAVGAMIAEAWAKRRYPAAFISKLTDALGEAMETQCWLDHALKSGYINARQHQEFDDAWQHVGAMIQRMMDRSDRFCRPAKGEA